MPDCSKCKPGITGEGLMISEDRMDQTQIDQLLLHCLRTGPDETGDGRVGPLSEADWEDLLQQSARHRITPLLYHRLRTCHPDIPIPPTVMEKLRQAYLGNAARNLMLYHNLSRVLNILRRESIPVIALKGAHLAELIYGNRSLRFMSDLDLLVRKDDLMKVDALLLEMGCTTTVHNRIVGKDNNQFDYLMPKRDVILEIHWSILSSLFPFRIDTDGQWARSRPALIAGVEAAVLCPEDLLLYLCLHASCAHGFEPGLRLFCDISEILQHTGADMDWGVVQRRTCEWGIGKSVYLTLKLTRELLGVALPEGLMEALKPRDFDEHIVALARDQIFSRRERTGSSLSLWRLEVARFWGSARLRDKGLLFLKGLFLPRDGMALLYPPPADSIRLYFYYVVRLRDLLRLFGHGVWRLLRRDKEMLSLVKEGKSLTTLKDWLMSP
ncbi:MAG: nucleotidyltransferase domain-containing protein [Syntrophales bacterium]